MNVKDLLDYPVETEWLEFKTEFKDYLRIGEYIAGLANSAAYHGKDFGYLVWGIEDKSKKVVGTEFDHNAEIKGESLQHYLARQIRPSISFSFKVETIKHKRLVILKVPSAKSVPVEFKGERYIRIGSSLTTLARYPEREGQLWLILTKGFPNMINTEAKVQNLTFERLFIYYGLKGIKLNTETFEENLKLKTSDGKFNILAQVLADDSFIPIRVSVFSGKEKSDKLYSVKEYGNLCIFYSIDRVLEYLEAINVVQADERNRVVTRKDVPYFDIEVVKEAILNAYVHNYWVGGLGPQIDVFSNRIDIISHGGLPADLTLDSFFKGVSKPVNEQLATIFLQLRISERSGRGVSKVIKEYGKAVYEFDSSFIRVSIPYNLIATSDEKVDRKVDKKVDRKLNPTQSAIILEIRNNPNITITQLQLKLNLGRTSITNNLKTLSSNGFIKRIGADKDGYWEVVDDEQKSYQKS